MTALRLDLPQSAGDGPPGLQTVAAALSQARTREEVAEAVLTHGLAALNADRGVLALLTDDGKEFCIVRAVGYPQEEVDPWRRFPADAHVPVADAVRARRPLVFETFQERQARYPATTRVRAGGPGAVAALPLLGERVLGGLGVSYPAERHFSEADLAFLRTLAGECARAVERTEAAKSTRVLVVDDNRDRAHILALLLKLKGYEVRTAYDGPAAVGLAGAFRPGVVLLDLAMPRMDGFEVARRLRQEVGFAEVLIAVTGYGQEGDVRRCLEAGFRSHLMKPVDLADLLRVLPSPVGK